MKKYVFIWLVVLVSHIIGNAITYSTFDELDFWQMVCSVSTLILLGLLLYVCYLHGACV